MKKLWENLKKVKQKDLKLIIPSLVALIVFAGALMGFEIDAMSLEQKLTAFVSGAALVLGVFANTDKK
jgi:uncharacterized membrane protein